MTVTSQLSIALADRYRIERELGAGGMATVYLAHDLKHDRKVAIKVLKPELAAVLGAERFVVEIKTTASLQHPHILPLFDSGTAEGFLFYVMPYIRGETIREKLNRETQFGIDDAVRIAREVADALDYAHRHGVIHRDIKPENILLHDGRAMVMDFGIALAVSAAAGGRMTETGLSLGTPHYMSPEQATAEKEISGRSDVYSLASVLYEMLAGQPPHLGGSAQQIIMKIIAEPVEAVTKFRKSAPPNVAAAVAKALEKLAADRFDSAKAFSDALANPAFVAATGVAGATGAKSVSGVSPRLFWATTAVALGAIAVAVWSWRRPDAPGAVTRSSIALADSQPLSELPGTRVVISPDGRMIVYVGVGATASRNRLYVRRLDQLDATPLAGTDGALNPAFSPDGTRIAFVNDSRTIQVIATGGGPISPLAGTQVGIGGLTWGSDGYFYYTPYAPDENLAGGGLARVRDTGGRPEPASTPDRASGERGHTNPSALPNGRGVIIAIGHGRGAEGGNRRSIGVLDAKARKHTVLPVQSALLGRYAASGHLVYVTALGILMAQPFDADRLEITGGAAPIADRVSGGGPLSADVAVSQTGTLVYTSGSRGRDMAELVWVARDGKATPVDSRFVGRFGRTRLSPDGRQAAVTIGAGEGAGARGAVWVKQLDRGSESKVLENAGAATWSPDGKTLVAPGRQSFVLGPADGSRLPISISVGTTLPESPEWSSDGKWLIYQSAGDIYAMAMSGDSAKIPLVTGPSVQRLPALSPDGRWLAYASIESGRSEVYVQPFPDTKLSKRTVSVDGGNSPQWSRNGRELFFVDESRHMVAVPIAPGATFVHGNPIRLFDATAYGPRGTPFDVAADGRFLMTRSVGAPRPDELILVQNFFEELKAKVKPK